MKPSSRYWSDLSTREFAQLTQDPQTVQRLVAVLPVAATEQHGPHLCVGVDTVLVDAMMQASLALLPQETPVLVLPTQAVGKSNEHARFPGTLSLSTTTLHALWMDIGISVARSGVRKLLLFNAHGGNVSMMDLVARDLREQQDMMVYSSSWYNLPLDQSLSQFDAQEQRFGVHAGAVETALMLAAYPQGVDMTQAAHFVSNAQKRAPHYPILGNGKSAKLGWQMQDYHPQGAAGNALTARADQGHRLLQDTARQLAGLMQEISSLPLSTISNHVDVSDQVNTGGDAGT